MRGGEEVEGVSNTCPCSSAMAFLQIACSVSISAAWSFTVEFCTAITLGLIASGIWIVKKMRSDSKMKTIAQAISLTVGAALLGWRNPKKSKNL